MARGLIQPLTSLEDIFTFSFELYSNVLKFGANKYVKTRLICPEIYKTAVEYNIEYVPFGFEYF